MTILSSWMADHGVTDDALATATREFDPAGKGITRVHILRLRHGQYRPSLRTARLLQRITGIDAGKLMTGDP